MLRPPEVLWGWCPIHCTLHIAKIWLSGLTRTVTSPPVLAIGIHFIMKLMIDLRVFKRIFFDIEYLCPFCINQRETQNEPQAAVHPHEMVHTVYRDSVLTSTNVTVPYRKFSFCRAEPWLRSKWAHDRIIWLSSDIMAKLLLCCGLTWTLPSLMSFRRLPGSAGENWYIWDEGRNMHELKACLNRAGVYILSCSLN